MATLIVTEGPAQAQQFALKGFRLAMIGRDAGCSFQIVDPQLSRYHLQIRHDEDANRHHAVDFNSRNGVFVNDRKIEGEVLLNDRDVIVIGQTTMIYSIDDSPEALRACEALKKRGQGHLHTLSPDLIQPQS